MHSLSLPHTPSLFYTHSLPLSCTLSLSLLHNLPLSILHTLSPSFTHTLSLSVTLSPSLTHTLYLSHTLSFHLSLPHTLSPPLSHTHTLSLSLSLLLLLSLSLSPLPHSLSPAPKTPWLTLLQSRESSGLQPETCWRSEGRGDLALPPTQTCCAPEPAWTGMSPPSQRSQWDGCGSFVQPMTQHKKLQKPARWRVWVRRFFFIQYWAAGWDNKRASKDSLQRRTRLTHSDLNLTTEARWGPNYRFPWKPHSPFPERIQLYCLRVEKFAFWLIIYIKHSMHFTIKHQQFNKTWS